MSQIFSYQAHQVRTITENNETWFVAKDVCEVLGLKWHGKVLSGISQGWQGMRSHLTPSGKQRVRVISEPAVYKLAFRSNKPEADAFTNWVASEVLPTIRKTGSYEAKPKQKALPAAPNTPQAKVDALLAKVRFYVGEISEAEKQITLITTRAFLDRHPDVPLDLRDIRYQRCSGMSCSTRSLWSAVNFTFSALEASLKMEIENSL